MVKIGGYDMGNKNRKNQIQKDTKKTELSSHTPQGKNIIKGVKPVPIKRKEEK